MSTFDGLNGAGCLRGPQEYMQFWDALADQSQPESKSQQALLKVLIDALTDIDKSTKAPEKDKKLTALVDRLRSCMMQEVALSETSRAAIKAFKGGCVNTITFLALASGPGSVEPDEDFWFAAKAWSEHRGDHDIVDRMSLKEMWCWWHKDPMDQDNKTGIVSLVSAISSMQSHAGMDCPLPVAPEAAKGGSVGRAFALLALKQFVKNNADSAQQVIEVVSDQLRSGIPPETQMVLMQLAMMVLAWGVPNSIDCLRGLALAVQPLFLAPLPVGSVAKRLLLLITAEARCRGTARRLVLRDPAFESLDNSNQQLVMPKSSVHLILGSSSRSGSGLGAAVFGNTRIKDTPTTRVLTTLISSVEKALGNSFSADWNEINDKLCSMGDDPDALQALEQLLVNVDQVCSKAAEMESQVSGKYLSSELTPLAEQMVALASNASASSGVQGQPRASASGLHTWKMPESKPSNEFDVDMPCLTWNMVIQGGDVSSDTIGLSKHVVCDNYEGVRRAILKHHHDFTTEPLRMVVAGGDGTVFATVSAVVAMWQTVPEIMSRIDVQLYLVPLGAVNSLSHYVALYDAWYARHVYCPFSSALPFVPHMDSESGACQASRASPVSCFEELVSSFVSEASQTLPVVCYQCECYGEGEDGTTQLLQTVPFTSRLELGPHIDKQQQQAASSSSGHRRMSWFELRDDRAKASPVDVSLSYSVINVLGVARQTQAAEKRSVMAIVLSNVGRCNERAPCPQPGKEWLEMYTAGSEPVKRRKSKSVAEYDYSRVQHIGRCAVESSTSFHVCIDGEYFGPYTKISVSASRAPGSTDAIKVGIRHFLPLSS